MKIQLKRSAFALIGGILAVAFEPPAPITPSAWAAANMTLPDGPYAGDNFNPAITPYLVEPLDFFADACPDNKAVFRKSKQIGATTLAIAACGYTIDIEPCDVFLIEPTDSNLSDFNGEKLQRVIDGSPAIKRKVFSQVSRSGKGSTTYSKRYRGGSILMAIATSTADLRGKTRKKVIRDEASEYLHDLDGQGSPHEMISGAYESFLASGEWKDLWISTPTIKGACHIDAEFDAGDQRYWHIVCPGCGEKFYFDSAPLSKGDFRYFKFNDTYPHKAYYVAPCCGRPIEGHEKNALVQNAERDGGGWIATAPGPGKHRSYHFDALSSPFVPWDVIAARIVAARNDPAKRKTLDNLTFGRAHEVRVDAPDHEVLMARRVEQKLGHIPPGALLLTVFADVQMRGIYVEVLAWAPDQQSWPIYVDYLDGSTTHVDQGAFAALTELYRREWPDAYGNRWRADEFGVDSGYRTSVVYEWTRRHPGTKATKGLDGWGRVPLGVATDQDINYQGKLIRGGAKVRGIGTWPLKLKFYTYAGLGPIAQGAATIYPPGYCHFGHFLEESYFKMLTSEYLEDVVTRGRPSKLWKQRPSRENHWLDCRVGNLALTDAYFASFTSDDWAARAKERGIPADLRQPDLFAVREFAAPTALKPVEGATLAPAPTPSQDRYFDRLAKLNKGLQ